MNTGEKRLIYTLLIIIIIFSGILLYKMNKNQYNISLYHDIVSKYDKIISEYDRDKQSHSNRNHKENTYIVVNAQGEKYKIVGRITIPKIDVNYPIISETTESYLKIAPTKLCGPNINDIGNFCIIGHNYLNNILFSRLSELEEGDNIFLSDNSERIEKYSVYDNYVVEEKEVSCLNQNTEGKKEVTLITCTKNRNKRLVVKCIKWKSIYYYLWRCL